MNVLNFSRSVARKVAAQVTRLEWVRRELVASATRVHAPKPVLVPIRVTVDRQKRART